MSDELNQDNLENKVEDVVEENVVAEVVVEDQALAVEAEPEVQDVPETTNDVAETAASVEVVDTVISSPDQSKRPKPKSSLATGEGSVIESPSASRKDVTAKSSDTQEKVAIFSQKNVSWTSVGKLYRGYNIVPKSVADKWLAYSFVRLATPEEVAKELGN